MAITQTRRQQKEAEKREKLFNTARSLFAEHGFEAVTVDDICQTAGFGKSFFYRMVRSKDDLFMAFAAQDRNAYLQKHYQYSDEESFESLFRRFMHVNFDYNKLNGKSDSRLSYISYIQIYRQEMYPDHFYLDELRRLIARGMREQYFSAALTPHEHYQRIHDWLIGFFIGWSMQPDDSEAIAQEYDRIMDAMIDMLLRK